MVLAEYGDREGRGVPFRWNKAREPAHFPSLIRSGGTFPAGGKPMAAPLCVHRSCRKKDGPNSGLI